MRKEAKCGGEWGVRRRVSSKFGLIDGRWDGEVSLHDCRFGVGREGEKITRRKADK